MNTTATPGIPNAHVVLEAGKVIGAAKVHKNPNPESKDFVIVPDGCKIEYVEREALPIRRKGIVHLEDLNSFIAYFNTTKGDGAKAIYGSVEPLQFTGLLNENMPDQIAWRDHGCKYVPKLSREWLTWTQSNKQVFQGNEAFAIWLEDNLIDVIDPDNGRLLEIALNFRVNSNAAFSNPVRLPNGEVEFNYTNQIEGSSQVNGGKAKIPELFTIQIPVFQGREAQMYKVEARFRYRLVGPKLNIHFELVRHHKVLEQAFNDMVDQIEEDAGVKVLYGSPEAR
jgi:uncharacterized protein YfdQ (DUF2303 family)